MTHIGKHDLNENETEWLEKYAKDVYEKCAKECQAALNKPISAEDIKAYLAETHTTFKYVEPEHEPEVEEESEKDERNID